MELKIETLKKTGKGSKLTVDDAIFAQPFNEGLVHQVLTSYQKCGRAGTRATKGRSDVRGGGAKPWRQKGTGRARAGTRSSPIWRSGGHTFAKEPYDYSNSVKVNKKVYKKSIACILSKHITSETFRAIDAIDCKSHKTKDFLDTIKPLEINKGLIICDSISDNLALSSRNVPNMMVIEVSKINPVMLYKAPFVIMTKAACEYYSENLK